MKQPEYSPLEALERIKLMMKYDMSKTLNENKEVISEQPSPGAVAATTAGLGAGALGAGALGAATTAATGLSGTAALTAGAGAVLSAPILLPAAAAAAAAYGLYKLVDWMANKDYGKDGFIQIMSVCKAPGASKLVPKMSKSEIRDLAYQIEDAKGSWNDDEDAIVSVFQKVESIADLCSLDKKVTGGLVKFLDDLTDSPSEWKMFTRPIAGMIEDTEIILPDEEPKKTGGTKTTKYKVCSGTYTQGCYSEVIKQVQGCLGGLVTDGKFGPKTNEKLKSAGFSSGFSDNDVDKICDKTDIDTDVSGEEIVINQNEI
jgi:hypothetical protein